MTKLRADLVNEALVRLSGKASGQDASNEDYAYVDGQVDPVLEDLAERNVAVVHPDDIPDGLYNHIAAVLAFQCSEYFGVVGDEYTKLEHKAIKGERDARYYLRGQTLYGPVEVDYL
jgi:S-adenosylmethionine synthetase